MVHIILMTVTVVLYLAFSISILTMLRLRAKRGPVGVQEENLSKVQGVFHFISELADVTCEVQGLENVPSDRTVLYVGNHRSYFDVLTGYVTVPGLTGFVAKREVLRIPLPRTWVQRINRLLLDHVDIKEGLKTILEGVEKVKSGISIWISPEDTYNGSQELTRLLPFYEGSLRIAQKGGCPVMSVATTGTVEIFEQHLPFIEPSHMCIHCGAPIYIKELPAEERKFPRTYTRDVIVGMLEDMEGGREQDK